eukprot:2777734-Pleurochrysis_carterae.AAC.1
MPQPYRRSPKYRTATHPNPPACVCRLHPIRWQIMPSPGRRIWFPTQAPSPTEDGRCFYSPG